MSQVTDVLAKTMSVCVVRLRGSLRRSVSCVSVRTDDVDDGGLSELESQNSWKELTSTENTTLQTSLELKIGSNIWGYMEKYGGRLRKTSWSLPSLNIEVDGVDYHDVFLYSADLRREKRDDWGSRSLSLSISLSTFFLSFFISFFRISV